MVRLWILVLVGLTMAGMAVIHGRPASADGLSISGAVWIDVNADGARQADEPGLGSWPITLRTQLGQETEGLTEADGTYRFDGLASGGYVVEIEFRGHRPSWLLTHPAVTYEPPYSRHVMLGETSVTGQDFGLHAPRDIPQYLGMAWTDAKPADFPEVRAYIDGVDCTGVPGILPPDMDAATYSVTVYSDALKPGCGQAGDTISFTINGRTANETAAWEPVSEGQGFLQGRGRLDLTAGAPFASFYVSIEDVATGGEVRPVYGGVVAALIGDKVCGIGLHRVWGAILVPVPSAEQEPGCGEKGAEISFAVDGFAVPGTRAWEPGMGEEVRFRLEASPEAVLAGPAFAYYTFELPARPADYVGQPEQYVEAFIGGVSCGNGGGLGPASVVVAVAPAELAPGCGSPGGGVSFRLNGEAIGTAEWQVGFQAGPALEGTAGDEAQPAETPSAGGENQIRPPDTGSGGLHDPLPQASARSA